jgi:cell division protein FtsI (penicillin-binding protein 3)
LTSSQFKIAGKTGTTKLPGKDKQYLDESNSVYQASFVGYFPADKPKYSCIVVITDPKKEYYGARVSGTVFAEIANKVWASSLDYHQAINEQKSINKDLPQVKYGHRSDLIKSLKALGIVFKLNFESDWLVADTLNQKVNLNQLKIF